MTPRSKEVKTAILFVALLVTSTVPASTLDRREWIFFGSDMFTPNTAQVMTDGPYTEKDCHKVAHSISFIENKQCYQLDEVQGAIAGTYDMFGPGWISIKISVSDQDTVDLVMTGPYRTERICREVQAASILRKFGIGKNDKDLCLPKSALESVIGGTYFTREPKK